ncbi:MAG: phosphatase PAP2 family protein, partial [Alphaproteobacteria bacterium]|nr:phosphatase PAP2 family protein [Alphaproteobacteria bacterium]
AEYGWFWILLCLVLIAIKKTRKLGIVCACSLLVTFLVCNLIVKPIVDRTRPWELFDEVQLFIKDPGDSSFPSGHSANSMAVAFALWLNINEKKYKKYGIIAIIFATMIGISRIYLGVHYPLDVLIGFVLGIICSIIVHKVFTKLEKNNVIIKK